MAKDTYTTTSVRTYGNRVQNSFIQSIFGIIFFLASFVVIFANEGASIKQEKMLKSGLNAVITVPSTQINPMNEGKLVHFTGNAQTNENLDDNVFPISINGINLTRNVSMYQWQEEKNERSKVRVGGSEEVTTTYTYNKTWSSKQIDSSKFWNQDYNNPPMLMNSYSKYANDINVDSFTLSEKFINKFNNKEELTLSNNIELPKGYKQNNNYFYNSEDINNPQIGDLMIDFKYIPLQVVSIIGKQQEAKIVPFETEFGKIIIAQEGEFSSKELFEQELKNNVIRTWVLRFFGFLLMFAGLRMIVSIIGTILSVLPFLQPTFAFISTPIVFIIALITSLLTIALSWMFYRPLISLAIFFVVIFLWTQMRKMKAKRKEKLQAELDAKNEGKLSGISNIIEGTYTEVGEKVNDTKDKIINILNKF